MSPLFKKRKKKSKEIEYEELKKNEAFRIRIKNGYILAFRLPEYEDIEAEAEAGAIKVGGEYKRKKRGRWNVVIKTEEFGLLPYETWKVVASKVLSGATDKEIRPEDIIVSGSIPVTTKETFKFLERENLNFLSCEFIGSSGRSENYINLVIRNAGISAIRILKVSINGRSLNYFYFLEPGVATNIQIPNVGWSSGRQYEIKVVSGRNNTFTYIATAP